MRQGVSAVLVGLAMVGMSGHTALAEIVVLRASLDQEQEVPAPEAVPAATGEAAVILDTATNAISFVVDFEGLSGDLTGVHFHGPAQAGESAGVVFNIGEVSGTQDPLLGTGTLEPAQATELQAGEWYVNLHTELNPAGELRGQLVAE